MKKNPDQLMPVLKAREIIRDLHIEEPAHIDIESIALMRGAIVREASMEGADGRLSALGTYGLITVREDIPERGKKRFVIAHELGHFELHRHEVPSISCTDADFREWSRRNLREMEANHFAAEILMPAEIFKKSMEGQELKPALFQRLCEEVDTSLTATAIRIATLRPEYALICSNPKGIQWFVVNGEHFPVFLNTRGRVHEDSLAHDCFKGEDVPEGFFPVEPHAWLESGRYLRGKLKEYAIYLKKYDQVLSFLYVEEGWD